MVSRVCADDRCLDGVVSDREEADISRMAAAVTVLLQGLGEDLHRDGLVNTPFRVARAFASAMKGYRMSAKDVIGNSIFYERGTTDPNGFGGGGMVIVRDLDHFATCRSCLLPFKIRSHIAYIPSGGRIVGLSKLARVVEIYSNRLQTPQEFVDGVGQALSESFKSLGVAVVAESWHLQWPLGSNGTLNGNGVKAVSENKISWVPSQAYTGKGIFNDKSCGLWNELIALLQLEGTSIHLPALKESFDDAAIGSCPFLSQDWKSSLNGFDSAFLPTRCNGLSGIKSLPNGGLKKVAEGLANVEKGYDIRIEALPAMVAAVESMLYAVGQDPKSHELEHTSMRYVVWLLASTQGNKISPCCQSKTYNNSNGVSITPSIQSPVADFGDQLDMYIVSKLRLPFCSQCEHHLLPFSGFVHVGYFYNPKTPPIERSLVSRIVQLYSRRLQVQERLTREIAEAVLSHSSLGVMVVVEASHLCMVSRGVKTISSSTTTVATLGRFSKDVTSRADFLRTISKGKTDFVG